MLVVLAAASLVPPAVSGGYVRLTPVESGVLVQLNRIRSEHRLVPLQASIPLTESAAQHSREMAADGYFKHASVDGTVFWKRIAGWYPMTGIHFWSVGENLLWSASAVDPADALKLWMASPEHRANILDPRWREIGVSVVRVPSAPGVYGELGATIITTDFGVRR